MQTSDYSRTAALDIAAHGRMHGFRQRLPQSALHVQPATDLSGKSAAADDVRLFVMSFIAFFLAIATFIS